MGIFKKFSKAGKKIVLLFPNLEGTNNTILDPRGEGWQNNTVSLSKIINNIIIFIDSCKTPGGGASVFIPLANIR